MYAIINYSELTLNGLSYSDLANVNLANSITIFTYC